MISWNQRTIAWYVRGSCDSRFHEHIARTIAPLISPQERVGDLGCGPGCLSLALAAGGSRIEALDTNSECLMWLARTCRERAITTIFPECTNALALP